MLRLLLATLSSASFGLAIRSSQRAGCHFLAVGSINYITASVFQLSIALIRGFPTPHGPTIWIGLAGGIVFGGSYFILLQFMHLRGISVTAVVMRLGILFPLGFSLLVWGEAASPLQLAGAMFAFLSLPFLALSPSQIPRNLHARSVILLFTLFLATGACALSIRGYHQTGIRGEEEVFFAVLFGTAALILLAAWALRGGRISRRDVPYGVTVGLANGLNNRFLIASLQALPSIVVYPIFTTGALVFTILFSWTAWRERPDRREMLGIALAACGVVLMNVARS